jgi:hypothetical protein
VLGVETGHRFESQRIRRRPECSAWANAGLVIRTATKTAAGSRAVEINWMANGKPPG